MTDRSSSHLHKENILNPFKQAEDFIARYYYNYGPKLFIVSISFAVGCLILHAVVNLIFDIPDKYRTIMVVSYVILGIIFVPMILSVT